LDSHSLTWARRLDGRVGVLAAVAFIVLVLVAAVIPQALLTGDPYVTAPRAAFAPPSLHHWFGTDQLGRDFFSRVVYGASTSLIIGVIAISVALLIGGLLGVGAALGGPWIDRAVNRSLDVLFAFPGLILALVFIALLGPSALTVAIAVGVGSAAGYARIIRAQTLIVVQSDYVTAERALGHAPGRILLLTILPNIARPLLPLFTLGVGQTIVWATGLSFLGLGAKPPAPEWGALLADSRNYSAIAWWLTVLPGAAIALTALSLTVVGRHLQWRFDGRSA
jgi:peptide/nickel transport system permease protein